MLLNFMHPSHIGKTVLVVNAIASDTRSGEVVHNGDFFELIVFCVGIMLFVVFAYSKRI